MKYSKCLHVLNDTCVYFSSFYYLFMAIYSLDLNSGIILWFQQFCAIFLKRVYHSIRFWAAIIWQLIIPLLFVLWGLIVAKTVPGITSEPPRRLISIMNSAPSNNITFFWASFVPGANLFQVIIM